MVPVVGGSFVADAEVFFEERGEIREGARAQSQPSDSVRPFGILCSFEAAASMTYIADRCVEGDGGDRDPVVLP